MVEGHLPHFLVGLSARAHVAAIRQDIAEALTRVVRRVALERGFPSASIEEPRGDLRFRIIFCPRGFRRAWSSLRVISPRQRSCLRDVLRVCSRRRVAADDRCERRSSARNDDRVR